MSRCHSNSKLMAHYGIPTDQYARWRVSVHANAVLAKGATEFGFLAPQPDFTGHQLCTSQPYVQWFGDPAPFHPTALGQLAIALTDQAVLHG